MTFKVTHINHHQRRRQLVIHARRRSEAEAEALLRLGAAAYLAVICLGRRS